MQKNLAIKVKYKYKNIKYLLKKVANKYKKYN